MTARRCRHCGSALDTAGRCPGDAPLLDPERDRREYGTAAQIAHRLGEDVSAALVRRWAYRSRQPRDRLHGLLPAHHLPGRGRGVTWYQLGHATRVEMLTRTSPDGVKRDELTAAG